MAQILCAGIPAVAAVLWVRDFYYTAFALVLLLRVFGKRELAQLNPFDLVVLLFGEFHLRSMPHQ